MLRELNCKRFDDPTGGVTVEERSANIREFVWAHIQKTCWREHSHLISKEMNRKSFFFKLCGLVACTFLWLWALLGSLPKVEL